MGPNPTETPRGRLRALVAWLTRSGRARPPTAPVESDAEPGRIGHYRVTGKLGQGGMGVVYAARDEKLDRTVAIKTMSSLASDDTARRRFWREARAAASVNHPNICQLYEIGEDRGELFIAMELLPGESLSARLARGPMSVDEVLPVALGILAALEALHARGIVHRDLKPSNVFLTPHGVKLLDFGLARPFDADLSGASGSLGELTRSGVLVGTPRYMAPEQVTGDPVEARADLFAAGAILFEMLAGRPAFEGRNVVEVLHGTLYEQPPALAGTPAVAAVDRVIRSALAKRPDERPTSAAAMADALRRAAGTGGGGATPVLARALTRIVVLPFRMLRPDPETDFLAFSLPDAISTSLSGIGSLVVRSSAIAARFAGEAPDLKAVASEADVDRVVMGTLLRAGGALRATVQLVEAPGGTLLGSHAVQSSLGDLFQLQDDIAHRVVEALSLPLTVPDPTPTPQAPPSPRAYGLYLRANEHARSYLQLREARDLYRQSLDLDPGFAPAWAQLGRCLRVIAKFAEASADGAAQAEEALARALELAPRLTVAHKFYANLEADTGQPQAAVVRLLGEAARHGNDPELFAGLVHACRYCGLFEQSIAAHDEARRLDPNVPTSVEQTLLMAGDYERLMRTDRPAGLVSRDDVIRAIGLGLNGRRDEAREALRRLRASPALPAFHAWFDGLLAWLDRRPDAMVAALAPVGGLGIWEDPEAMFQQGWLLCDAGATERGFEHLQRAVGKGYSVVPTLSGSPSFESLRGTARFERLLAEAVAGRQRALSAFREAGGERLLGG